MKRFLLIGMVVLTACARLPERPPAADPESAWAQHHQSLSRLDTWRLTGRLAIRTEAEGWYATVDWRQNAQHYDIRLIGPFGQGSVRLEGGLEYVTLSDGDGSRVVADDPETLLYHELGWRVPVEALRFWVLGLPAPGRVSRRQLDPYGRLASLEQSGWRVEFDDYQPQGPYELPGRVFVTDTEARVRLIVGRWRLSGDGDRES